MDDFARDRPAGHCRRTCWPRCARATPRLRSDDAETLATINAVPCARTGRIIDPHTAVAVAAARKLGCPEEPVVILSTAHPAKFPDAVAQAIGAPPALPERLRAASEHCLNGSKPCPTSSSLIRALHLF